MRRWLLSDHGHAGPCRHRARALPVFIALALLTALWGGLGGLGVSLAPMALAAGRAATAGTAGTASTGATGTIDGNLVDGTTGGKPLAGQTVALMQELGADERQVATTVTDQQGLFHFAGVAAGPSDVYVATVEYQGARYATDPLAPAGGATTQVTLLAYEATASDAEIGIAQVTVLVRPPDVPAGLISVAELVTVLNGGQRTYVGTPGPGNGKPMNLLRFGLPPGATDLTASDGFGQGQPLQVDQGFATTTPVLPGQTRFAFTYSFPYSGTRALWSYQARYPTLQLVVLAPPEMGITAPALAAQGGMTAAGQRVQVWQGQSLLAGTKVSIVLAKLPVPGEPSTLNLPLLYGLAGLLAALAFGLVGYHFLRLRGEAGIAVVATSQRAGGDGDTGRGDLTGPTTQDLLAALAQLDQAREAGKLGEERYRARRAALKGELKARMLAETAPPAGGDR